MENQKNLGRKIKFGVIASGLVVVGLVIGYVLGVFGYVKVIGPYLAEIKYKQWLADYLKPYKEDFVGGNTPEETIDLFIAALKKGDYDLASRYFVVEKREKVKQDLKVSNRAEIIGEIEYAKNSWKAEIVSSDDIKYWYNTIKEGIEMTNEINLTKNVNNKWKIYSMYIFYIAD